MSDQDKHREQKPGGEDRQELDEILGRLTESSETGGRTTEKPATGDDIIRKPQGQGDQPEDLEGLLDKISEAPEKPRKQGFFQRLLAIFKGS